MTEQLTESTGARPLVREIPEGHEWRGIPCWVRERAAAGPCRRPSVVKVYEFALCEEHGAECKAGALEELYIDADVFFERLQGDPPLTNPLIGRIIQAGWSQLGAQWPDYKAQDEALRRAYPFRRDLMDEDFRNFDYAGGERMRGPDPTPPDWCRHQRYVIHKLMRLAFEEDADYLMEDLEKHREHVSAQLAYVLVDSERKLAGAKA